MSFYSYKNANADACPGAVNGNVCNGLSQKVCVQVKNVYDACLQQQQIDDVVVTVVNIVPVLPDPNCRHTGSARGCTCSCTDNQCSCTCPTSGVLSHEDAVHNAENHQGPLPTPCGQWTFESCRSSTTKGNIRNLTIDRMCDRPQFARIKGVVDIPIDVLFTDERCQEWMGNAVVSVSKDVLLAIPEESIVPFTLESLVSAICVTGTYIGNCKFEITICVTVVLKILAEVEVMIPTYGFCQIPPCEEFADNVCDEFFSLPLFPRQSCPNLEVMPPQPCIPPTPPMHCGTTFPTGCCQPACSCTCSNCGTTCASGNASLCPRCGCTMTAN